MAGRAVGLVGARGQPLDWPRFPRPALCRGGRRRAPWGLLLGEPVQEQVARRRIEPANVGGRRQGDGTQALSAVARARGGSKPWSPHQRLPTPALAVVAAATHSSSACCHAVASAQVGPWLQAGEASRPVLLDLCDLYVLRFQ